MNTIVNLGSYYSRRRLRFLPPDGIGCLFVGESPPMPSRDVAPDRRRFFYNGKGALFKATLRAFRRAGVSSELNSDDFLRSFSSAGCYLEDLSNVPINRVKGPERSAARKQAVSNLTQRFQRLRSRKPCALIIVMPDILPEVQRSRDNAGLYDIPTWVLPFPRGAKSLEYERKLTDILKILTVLGCIRGQ